jgi:hypothetical protein
MTGLQLPLRSKHVVERTRRSSVGGEITAHNLLRELNSTAFMFTLQLLPYKEGANLHIMSFAVTSGRVG